MQPYPQQPGYPAPPPPPQKSNVGLIIGIVLGVVALIGIVVVVLAILAVSGTRKYISNAKQAEVKNTLGQIGKDAIEAYELEHMDDSSPTPTRHLCKSAAHPVPAEKMQVRGVKYQSTSSDWTSDAKDAGWTCLRFEMYQPQYYQYDYQATSGGFVAYGRGDLNGDGKFSEFSLAGKLQNEHLTLAPTIMERDPEE